MNTAEFNKVWVQLPPRLKQVIENYVKYPTESNQSYAVGFIAGLEYAGLLHEVNYSYLLALFGQLFDSKQVLDTVKELLT